jgi:excisionase family DNA binding protein
MSNAHELLRVEEVATLLRTTPKAIYAMVERRSLRGVVRIGRRVLVRRQVLLDCCTKRPRHR